MKYLYIGRFQPFHLGHLDAIKQAFGKGATHVMLGLGSVGVIDDNNPRTEQQREIMILDTLGEACIDPSTYSFELIPDFPSDLEWYNNIIDTLPRFDVVMSGNPRVKAIFDSCTHTVFDPEIHSKVDIHATQIREWLANNEYEKMKKFLGESVVDFLLNTSS